MRFPDRMIRLSLLAVLYLLPACQRDQTRAARGADGDAADAEADSVLRGATADSADWPSYGREQPMSGQSARCEESPGPEATGVITAVRQAAAILPPPQESGEVCMPHQILSPLTGEQWQARDYRQTAREIDGWVRQANPSAEDSTEYVAKLGVNESGSVIVMNRAHDRVLVPPPARAALAAFALVDQPFGFSHADVAALEAAAEAGAHSPGADVLRDLAARIQALVPPNLPES